MIKMPFKQEKLRREKSFICIPCLFMAGYTWNFYGKPQGPPVRDLFHGYDQADFFPKGL